MKPVSVDKVGSRRADFYSAAMVLLVVAASYCGQGGTSPGTRAEPIQMGADGILELPEPGRYPVSAEYDGQRLETAMAVTAATLKSISVSPKSIQIAKGLQQAFTAKAAFSDGTTQDVTALSAWSTKDVSGTSVAVIKSNGVATAMTVGKAQITAHYKTFSATATMQVTAATLASLSISPASASIGVGSSQTFGASVTYTDGTVQDVTAAADWAVMDLSGSGVAEVDGAGVVVGESAGQALVSVYYGTMQAQATLTVNAVTLTTLAVSPKDPSIDKGGTQQFTAIGGFSDGTTQDLTSAVSWSATDIAPGMGVATIDSSGLCTGNSGGQATITASYRGQTAATVLTVSRRTASCSADGWCPQESGTSAQLNSVWASDANHAFAVGAAGTILSWDGTAWTAQTSGTSVQLNSVWGSDASHVWAVGDSGTILSWDGSAWSPFVTGTDTLRSVWGVGPSNVWVVGYSGTILNWDGTAWQGKLIGDSGGGWYYLSGVWASDAGNVLLAGNTGGCSSPYFMCGTIFDWNGFSWTLPLEDALPLSGIWGSDASHAWAIGAMNTATKESSTWIWNGSSWSGQPSGTTNILYGVGGGDGKSVFTVGQNGTILKWNGGSWTAQQSGTGNSLQGVGGSDANNIWAVGQNGTILNYVP